MRRALHLYLTILLATEAMAQPMLSAGSISYQPGESFTEQICAWVDQGPPGAAQAWDFSTLAPFSSFTSNWVAGSAGQLNDYPTATVVYQSQSYFGFYEGSAAAFRFLGDAQGITLTGSRLLDPADEIRYPFNFGDTYTDTFGGWTYFPNGSGGQDSAEFSGTLSVTFDGYGELTLPWGIVPEVIRLHKVRTTPSASDTITETEYRYYEPGMHHPWLRTFRRTNSNSPTVTESARYIVPASAGISPEAEARAPMIAPNPAMGIFELRAEGIEPGTRIALRDVSGREVMMTTAGRSGAALIDATDLGNGSYVLTFPTSGTLRSLRFIKH